MKFMSAQRERGHAQIVEVNRNPADRLSGVTVKGGTVVQEHG